MISVFGLASLLVVSIFSIIFLLTFNGHFCYGFGSKDVLGFIFAFKSVIYVSVIIFFIIWSASSEFKPKLQLVEIFTK